jgi:hypothetical protein
MFWANAAVQQRNRYRVIALHLQESKHFHIDLFLEMDNMMAVVE